MKLLIKIALIPVILATIILAKPLNAQAPIYIPKVETPTDLLTRYAALYKVLPSNLIQVATCESKLNPKAYNPKDTDGLPAYGLMQFKKNTFLSYAKKINITYPDIWNPDQQAEVAAYMFSLGDKGRRQWGCYNHIYGK